MPRGVKKAKAEAPVEEVEQASEGKSVAKKATVDQGMAKVDSLIAGIQKKYGSGAIMRVGQIEADSSVEWAALSSLTLTEFIGKGIPWSRHIEIYGAESSSKTSLACYLGGQIQKAMVPGKNRFGRVAYIDVENALDLEYARSFGLNVDAMLLAQADSGEQALGIAEDLVESGEIDCIVIDSVACLTPQAELDGEMGDASVGAQARLMSKALRKINVKMKQNGNKVIVIWINQTRMKIGVMYGNPETTSGGNALKFYASIRIEARRKDWLCVKEGDPPYGGLFRYKTVKNKVSAPFRVCEMRIIFGSGYDIEAEIPNYLISNGIIQKSGGWYTFFNEGVQIAKVQGMESVVQWLKDNPEMARIYKDRLYKILSATKLKVDAPVQTTQRFFPGTATPIPPEMQDTVEGDEAPVVVTTEELTEEEMKEAEGQDMTPEEAAAAGFIPVGDELDVEA